MGSVEDLVSVDGTEGMEYSVRCKWCPREVAWTTETAAKLDGLWHLYVEHREVWNEVMDNTEMVANVASAFGRKYEDWERQS